MSGIIARLLELQSEEGWLPSDRLAALAVELRVPLHRLESVSTFYTHFLREAPSARVVSVCRDLSCQLAGSGESTSALRS